MRGNYIAVFIHGIWTTKYRLPLLPRKIRYPLLEHMRKHALEKEIDLRIINGVDDHLHCLFRLTATQTYSWVLQLLKGEASNWLNKNCFSQPMGQGILAKAKAELSGKGHRWEKYFPTLEKFSWQDGYGAISVSPQKVGSASRYIFNQEAHHKKLKLEKELELFKFYSDDKNLDGISGG